MIRLLLLVSIFYWGNVYAQELLDPTRPPHRSVVSEGAEGAEFTDVEDELSDVDGIPRAVVSAIFVSSMNRYAIINNDVVVEGETWKNVLLTKVNHDSIELTNGESRRIVKIFSTDVAKERAYVY